MGKLLVIIGLLRALFGGLLLMSGRIPWIGRLPGDIVIQRKNFTVYFPIVTSILLSILFTLVLWLVGRR